MILKIWLLHMYLLVCVYIFYMKHSLQSMVSDAVTQTGMHLQVAASLQQQMAASHLPLRWALSISNQVGPGRPQLCRRKIMRHPLSFGQPQSVGPVFASGAPAKLCPNCIGAREQQPGGHRLQIQSGKAVVQSKINDVSNEVKPRFIGLR